MTFSIVARCAKTGMFGVAVCSSSPAVGARCGFVRAGVGAVASQNITDPELGPALLEALAAGEGAERALASLVDSRAAVDYRQLIAVDVQGGTAGFSGARTLGVHALARARDVAAAGNLLANPGVPAAMTAAFEAAEGPLGERLIAAMSAGLHAGGEAGPVHSIGLKIAHAQSWPFIDLRVDWAQEGVIDQLRVLWDIYAPQADDYVRRALDPAGAPRFGAPGDL